jgi:hypothetical protein
MWGIIAPGPAGGTGCLRSASPSSTPPSPPAS